MSTPPPPTPPSLEPPPEPPEPPPPSGGAPRGDDPPISARDEGGADPRRDATPRAARAGIRPAWAAGPRFRRWAASKPLRIALFSILAVMLLVAGGIVGTIAWLTPQLPPLDQVIDYRPRQPLQVFTRDGVEIGQFGTERRQYVPIALIPKRVQDALLAVEDARFREHEGIDFLGVARAVVANLSGGMRQGASTITQQVARTFFLSSRRTWERKLKEALLARQIERRLSKDQILELYMNQVYMGQRAYGFAAAAQVYFGKTLDQLSTAETAMLVGLPQNPAYANPLAHLDRARERQAVVLARMRVTHLIDDAEFAAAKAEPLKLRATQQAAVHAEYVAEMARRMVVDRFGDQAYSAGYKVTTSIVAADQQAAWSALRRGILAVERRQPWRGPEDTEELQDDVPDDEQAAQILKDRKDDEELRLALVTKVSAKSIVAQLASGETIRLVGDGIRWALPALSDKAPPELALRRGAVIRVVRQPPAAVSPAAAASAAKAPKNAKDASSGAWTGNAAGSSASASATGTTVAASASTAAARASIGADGIDEGWAIGQWPEIEGAFVSMDPATGRVRSLVGGFDFSRQPFNHVTQAWRQPGSSFKPFLYSAALEHGVMPQTVIEDAPLPQPEGADPATAWNPQNSDGRFDGPLTLRQALARSKNLVSIRILEQIGIGTARDWAARFGFEPDKQPENLTLALGAGSTTPLQLASAYAVFANGGHRVAPVAIERIADAHGVTLFEAPPAQAASSRDRVIPERNVFLMQSLLQEVTRSGTAARAQQMLKRPDIYGKTGTTNDAVDAWFAGFQPGLVATVWLGYDAPKSLGSRETGGGVALPVWIEYMAKALKDVPVAKLVPPEGLARRDEDWIYDEWAEGGFVEGIGLDEEAGGGVEPEASASAPPAEASGAR